MVDNRPGAWRARRPPTVGALRDDHAVCPVGHALDVVGGRWSTLIVHRLLDREMRFGEIRAALGGINPKTLTDQLRQLEADGILTRTAYGEIPPGWSMPSPHVGAGSGRSSGPSPPGAPPT